MPVLVLGEHDLGVLSPATARLVAGAEKLGGPVDLLLVGEDDLAPIAGAGTAIEGVARVRTVSGVSPTPEALVPLLASLASEYDAIIAASSAFGRGLIPRLAAKLDLMPVTDVIAVLGPDRFQRPIYAGNAVETLMSPQPRHLLTLRASAFMPKGQGGPAPIEPITGKRAENALCKTIANYRTQGDRPDLSIARIVVGGGVAVGSAEGFKLIEQLATRLGAAVGATRAAVDAGFAPNDWQVGQTGKIIAPDLYIAIGISGALQHLAGIGGAKKIIAINTDPEAPLFKLADLALEGDLFTVIPALIAKLDALGVKP